MSIKKASMASILPMKQIELTEKNFNLFAAKNYINPRVLDPEEFEEDLIRFKYLKRLFSRYKEKQELQERLILNHLTVIHNVFRLGAATEMCFFKIDPTLWPALKTFLLYANLLPVDGYESIPADLYVAKQLQTL
jgi:hypothetical protein